jgi:hypothetical protein
MVHISISVKPIIVLNAPFCDCRVVEHAKANRAKVSNGGSSRKRRKG